MSVEEVALLREMATARRPTVSTLARWTREVEAIVFRADRAEYKVSDEQREAHRRIIDERNRIDGIIRREIGFALLPAEHRKAVLKTIGKQLKTGRRT